MQKKAAFLLALFLFAPKIIWPQEASSNEGAALEPGQESSQSQEISQDKNSEQAQEEPGAKDSDRSLIQKAKGLVKEFNEQKEAEQEEGPVNAVQFLGDFLTDRLPLTLDLGAEPGEDGSLVFASLQYDWREHFSSRIRFEYKSAAQTTDIVGGYEKLTSKSYGAALYPAIWYFGDTDEDSQEALWSLGVGASCSFVRASNASCYALSSSLAYIDVGMKYFVLAPVLTASVKKPLGRFLGAGAEFAIEPVSGIFLNMDIRSNLTQTNAGAFSYYTESHSAPSFVQSVWLDVLKYIRLKGSLRFSRLALESARYDYVGKKFFLYELLNNEIEARGGVELVLPTTNKSRKKDSHLWAGVYYQHTWTVQEALGQSSASDKGKWVICFGK